MHISQQSFGYLPNGEEVFLINMKNSHGIEIEIITYGAIIKSLKTPDLKTEFEDIVLGKDDLQGYISDDSCLGAVAGPVAGRIGNAKAMIGGKLFEFDKNDGDNSLHGGRAGLQNKNWKAEMVQRDHSVKLELTYKAEHLEGGYPGNRLFKATYILNEKNQLLIYFDATTDQDTIINMSTHSYFNLSGKHQTIYDHKMMLNSMKILNVKEGNLPDGSESYVLGTAYNFSRGGLIGEALQKLEAGIDHAYIINKEFGTFGISAKVVHEASGRTMDIVTDQPVLVFYTANHYDGSQLGKSKLPLEKHHAFCLEPQFHPDAPHHSHFPSIEIKTGEKYKSRTQITFGLTTDEHHH
jgi:aldose 1-epimerase